MSWQRASNLYFFDIKDEDFLFDCIVCLAKTLLSEQNNDNSIAIFIGEKEYIVNLLHINKRCILPKENETNCLISINVLPYYHLKSVHELINIKVKVEDPFYNLEEYGIVAKKVFGNVEWENWFNKKDIKSLYDLSSLCIEIVSHLESKK